MLTLLLVGRSGNGRSSVGNTILGDRNAFEVMGSSEDMSLAHGKQNNGEFVVVDCIGIGNTGFESEEDIWSAISSDTVDARELDHRDVLISTDMASGVSQHLTLFGEDEDETGQMESFVIVEPDSAPKESERLTTEHIEVYNGIITEGPLFHALIFVMKYGVRFTKQEKDAVQMVKSVFGDNVFKDWGILVFSFGDNFYQDSKDDGIKFEHWCREQTGDIRSLFQEVDYRCVIFDNKTSDESKQKEQRQNLKECIDKVREKEITPYTLTQFKQAEFSRIKEEEFKPLQRETELILRKANEKTGTGEDEVDWVVELNVQLGDYLLLLNKLDGKDRDGALNQMRDYLHDQINILNDLLAKENSKEFLVNFSSLQMLDNVKTHLNHFASYIFSFLNLGFNITEYFKSFTT